MNRPKRIPALLLALVLALGLTTPALAAGQTVAVSTNEPYSSNETISVTLSNVLAVKEMDILSSYPDDSSWDGTGPYTYVVAYEIMPITVYCLPRTGSVLTVTTNMETNPHHSIGCALVGNDLQTYDGFDCSQIKGPVYELGRVSIDGNLVGSPAGPDKTTYNIDFDMVGSFNDTDIYCIYVNYVCEFYFTFNDLPGVPSVPVEGIEEETPQKLQFKVNQSRMLDNGVGYNYTITNNTDQKITGYYALLSYQPKKGLYDDGTEYLHAQLHTFDVDLAPGKSMSSELSSYFYNLSGAKNIWITFDSKAERDSFLANRALADQGSYYLVTSEQWLKDNFNITLRPAK